jgi:hypothetical protein
LSFSRHCHHSRRRPAAGAEYGFFVVVFVSIGRLIVLVVVGGVAAAAVAGGGVFPTALLGCYGTAAVCHLLWTLRLPFPDASSLASCPFSP